jgi:SAM-dependent methyltransferase
MTTATSPPPQERTKATYSLQWNRFRILRPEEDRATFWNRTGLKADEVAGKTILDAGCGMGRYVRVAGEAGAKVVGLDLSEATRAARALTSDLADILILRGDLLRPPMAEGTFDHIYSIGVLDHTPDPRAAFLAVAKLLKPGGRIAIWIYRKERPLLERIINAHRAISTRLPLGVLLPLCRLMAPVGGVKRKLLHSKNRAVAKLGVALNVMTIGVSMHPDPEVRVCDTLDWYAPQYMSRHTYDEVAGWFAEAGLVDVIDVSAQRVYFHAGQGNGINVAGRRPTGDVI